MKSHGSASHRDRQPSSRAQQAQRTSGSPTDRGLQLAVLPLLLMFLICGMTLEAAERAETVLKLHRVEQQIVGNVLTVTGTLTNPGQSAISSVSISVSAVTADQRQVGSLLEDLAGSVARGGSRQFSVRVDVAEYPSTVRVFVTAPVDRVVVER